MTPHAIMCQIMISLGILGIADRVTTWTSHRPVISQRMVKTISVGPNMCAGFKTAGLTN